MLSQSGALGLAMLALARQRHVGISTFISVGNKADISGNDLLQYWEGDEATRVILLYLESFGNPRRFARIARGVSRGKPIVVVKPGRRAASLEAGSGAAALVADDTAVDALFRQTGVIRAETLDEMFDLASALDRQPLPAGRRVAILSDRSGPGILCAGACEAARLSVPPLSDSTAKRLEAFLPAGTAIGNPLELAASATADQYARALESLLLDREVDSVIAIQTPLDADESAAMLEAIRQGTARRARGGRRRQAGPGLPRGEGGCQRADRARRREHSHVCVPGIGRARARKGRDVRGVASGPARDRSRLRRHRPRLRARNLPVGDRRARSGLAHGGRGESGPSGHAPSRRSGRGRPHGRRGRQGGPERRVPGRRQVGQPPGFSQDRERGRPSERDRRDRGPESLRRDSRFPGGGWQLRGEGGRARAADGQERRRGDGRHVRGPFLRASHRVRARRNPRGGDRGPGRARDSPDRPRGRRHGA